MDVQSPPVLPRLTSLDLLRGVAILMILPANIPLFSDAAGIFGQPTSWPSPTDYAVWGLTLFFVVGKFITLLSIVFGAGLAIQADRAAGTGRPFVGYYLWRTFLLFLIGLAHGILLWYGDILTTYAMAAVIALFVSRLGPIALKGIIAGCLIYSYAGALLITLVAALLPPELLQPHSAPSSTETAAQAPVQAFERYFLPENQTRIYREGTFGEITLNRAIFLACTLLVVPFTIVWYVLPCFLIGVLLLRRGVFADPHAHPKIIRRLLLLGLCVGLPLQVVALAVYLARPEHPLSGFLDLFAALPLALGYLGVLLLWSQSGWLEGLQRPLRAVGRAALSNYLLQSLLCGLIFYSYGLGQFGKLDRLQCLGVVGLVWLVCLTVSPLWLRFFPMGPVEWLWRSLADRHWRPFLRKADMADLS